jgi:hypothetical protein
MRIFRIVLWVGFSWIAATPAGATWAVILTDTETGEVGIGQATCVSGIDLRSLSAVIVTGHGVATVQAFVDSSGVARTTIRDELLAGTPPDEILNVLSMTDPQHETHQYCIVDTAGGAATYTGTSAQGLQYAGGQTGEVGGLRYCVAGNVLTGAPVVEQAVQAVVQTAGSLADKLMAAMQAARAMGGDGRCSCSPGNPTGCGSPPADFELSAINGYLVVGRSGDTEDCAICSGGDYYLDLEVSLQDNTDPDPVLVLQSLYDQALQDLAGRPDAVESIVTIDPPFLLPDGISTALLDVLLLDLNASPIALPIASFGVAHAPDSDGASTIGVPANQGGGQYSVTLTAGTDPGVDLFHVTADDGVRPVIQMPSPRLSVGVPGAVQNLRWSDPVTLEWTGALGAVEFHVYRGGLDALSCSFFGECQDASDPDSTDRMFSDPAVPPSGAGFFYLVTAEEDGGNEGTLGISLCGVRENSDPCP